VPDPIDRHAARDDDDVDDEAPTQAQRTPRVVLHPKLDPRRIPTQRRLAVVRSITAPAADPDLAPPSTRGGVSLTWVVLFISAAYIAILVAVVLAVR
jgi:hypothetical protein